jgi:hypothetical protein
MSKSSLISDLQAAPKVLNRECKFIKILNSLKDESEQKALYDAISLIRKDTGSGHGKTYSTVWLARIMRKNKLNISVSAIQRHVNKECSCVEHSE